MTSGPISIKAATFGGRKLFVFFFPDYFQERSSDLSVVPKTYSLLVLVAAY